MVFGLFILTLLQNYLKNKNWFKLRHLRKYKNMFQNLVIIPKLRLKSVRLFTKKYICFVFTMFLTITVI